MSVEGAGGRCRLACPGALPAPAASHLQEAAADEDPALQGVLLALHHDWRADVQVAEGVKARGTATWISRATYPKSGP